MTSELIKVNNSKTAAVNQAFYWIPIDEKTPVGVRLQLINRRYGVAVISSYHPGTSWTHWQGLPKFMDDYKAPDTDDAIARVSASSIHARQETKRVIVSSEPATYTVTGYNFDGETNGQ